MPLFISHIRSFLSTYTPPVVASEGLTPAAVLVPIVETGDGLHVLLTKRTDQVEHHKGQISFPGGAMDDSDMDLVATALREAEEEIGLDPADVEVLGVTDGLETPTGFVITPVVGYLKHMPRLRVNKDEVEEAFTVPVEFLLDSRNEAIGERVWRGQRVNVYTYEYGGHQIWGATAWVLRTFLRKAASSSGLQLGM